MNLVIGIPSAGNPARPFVESLSSLTLPQIITGFDNLTVTGNFVPAQRELIARHALRVNADLLLMIDDDMILPSDTVTQLLDVFAQNDRCGIVGGLYYARDGIRPMAVANWNPAETTSAYTPAFAHKPVSVDGVGFGCVLIDCNLLRVLTEPYFPAQLFLEESRRQVRVCNEDYLFCHRAKSAGYSTFLHAGVRLGHYDRASDTVFPTAWESEAQTNRPRMTVVRPDGTYALEALDDEMPRVAEQHVPSSIDYIIVR